jgi:hypothetical protein
MKSFYDYLNESTIIQILDFKEKAGAMPYDSIWTSDEAMTKRLGLTQEQIQSMKQNGVLVRVSGGWKIDKDKLQQYPQIGTAPSVPTKRI